MKIHKDVLMVLIAAPVALAAPWSGGPVVGVVATVAQLCLLAVVYHQGARRRRAEEQLHQAVAEAEAANRTKAAFLANMSHELRTPLNAIIGFAEVLDGCHFGDMNEKQADYVRDIQSSGRHLLVLISDILDMSSIEAGQVELREDDVDLATMLASARAHLAGQARAGGVSLICRLPETLPPLRADPARLRRSVLALLANAVKFTPPGGQVSLSAAARPDGGLELILSDTGIGMTEAELVLALQPFHQIDGPLAKRFAGAGLGLSLARSLVALHGGRLEIVSGKDQGTTVTMILPPERVLWRKLAA